MSFVPISDREYLGNKGIPFSELEFAGQKAIILPGIRLPPNRFDAEVVDVLIILPNGYPDVNPDMFYTFPWVRLTNQGRYPRAADQPLAFSNRTWQRWSRHSSDWRPGCDGIHTLIKRMEYAFEAAEA